MSDDELWEELKRYAARILGEGELATSVVWIVKSRLEGRERWRQLSPSGARRYAFAAVKHECLKTRKGMESKDGATTLGWALQEQAIDGDEATLDKLINSEAVECVQKCLEGLSESDRYVVALRFSFDFKPKKIAEILSKQPGAVRTQLSKALNKLRPCVERCVGP